jgi:Rnl2 family RNA ligase
LINLLPDGSLTYLSLLHTELHSNQTTKPPTTLPILFIMDDGAPAPPKHTSPSRKENPNGFKEQDNYGKKYGHIENFTTATMEAMRFMSYFVGAMICILPKLDGTHCSFEWPPRAMDVKAGLVVSACKRTGFIGDATGEGKGSEKFFTPGFPTLIKAIQGAILDLCQEVRGATDNVAKIRIHGEVVGGYYPHVDVPENDEFVMINKNVAYCPDHRFVVYDIEVEHTDGKNTWLEHSDVVELCNDFNIYVLEPIVTGKFEDVMGATYTMLKAGETPKFTEASSETNYMCPVNDAGDMGLSPIFRPMIPTDMFGFPAVEQHEEGWMIKVVGTNQRSCLKFKHPGREEIVRPKKVVRPKKGLSDAAKELFTAAQSYITAERLQHVHEKQGDNDKINAPMIKGKFLHDIMTEFGRHHEVQIVALPGKKDIEKIKKQLRPLADALVDAELPKLNA